MAICVRCGEKFDYENALFECCPDLCESCTQEEIKDQLGYEGDII